jgi:predicted Zn-dependent protease
VKRVRRTRWIALITAAACLLAFAAPYGWGRYCRYRGARALGEFQTAAALEWLQKATDWDPRDPEARFLLSRAFRRAGRLNDMETNLAEAARLGSPGARIERERRLSIAQTGRVREVEPFLPEMLANPGNDGAEICASFVSGYCLNFDFDRAGTILEAWAKDFPTDPEPFHRTGDLWYSQNEWDRAVQGYRRCLELRPDYTKARLSLAQCLLRQNTPAEAEGHFRQCLREGTNRVEALSGLGTCLMSLGRLEEARTAFEEVVSLAPREIDARRRLGELELSLGRPEQAIRWVEELSEKWPDDKVLCTIMAQANQELGRTEEARTHWEGVRRAEKALTQLEKLTTAVREDPTNPDLRYEIGMMLIKYRSREDGVGWLLSLLQYAPAHAGAHEALARYYSQIGETERAERHESFLATAGKARGAP